MLVQPEAQHWSPPVQVLPPLQELGGLQTPLPQVSPWAQPMPQPPQLLGSVLVLVQPAEQQVSAPVQAAEPWQPATQTAPVQESPEGHTAPQPPQL
jgi:hypothetical protein